MHILSTVARSITSRSLARVEQIQSNHGSYVRFFTCSCSLCGAEAPRPAEDGMHHSRLTLPGGGPVIVEHSKGGADQAGASDSHAVSVQPPERPKAPSAWGSFGSKIAKARPIPKVVKKGPASTGVKGHASGSTSSSKTTTLPSSTGKAKSAKRNPSLPASAQWGTFHALQVQGPAPNPNPPPKPKLLSRPRAGAPAPRWKRNSLPAQARAGKWGGFHQEQGAPASGHVDDEGLVLHDGHWSNVDPVVEGNLELSLETSLSKDVGDNSEEVGAIEVPSEVLTEQPVLSNPQHRQNAASVSTSKRGKERARAVPRTRFRRSGPKSAAGSGTGSWGNFFEDIERSDPEIARMTGNEEEADAPAPSRSIAGDTASSSAYVSSERDAPYGTHIQPEPTPDFYEDILPLPSRPHESNASKAEDIPALAPRAGPGEAEFKDSSTQPHPDQHQPAVQEDMTIMSRQQALSVLLQEPVKPVPRDINEQEHAAVKEGRTCYSDIVSAEQRLTEQRHIKEYMRERSAIYRYPEERRGRKRHAEERRIREQELRTEERRIKKLRTAERRVEVLREEERRAHKKARQADERRAAEFRILERRIKELGESGPSPKERLMERYANFQAMLQSHPSNITKEALRDFDDILKELSTETVEYYCELEFIRNWLYWLRTLVSALDVGSIDPGVCELCERETHKITRHHVIPRSQRDRDRFTIEEMNELLALCLPCHTTLHRAIPNKELADEFNSLARIMTHPRMQSWLVFAKAHSIGDLHGLMRLPGTDGTLELEEDERRLHLLHLEEHMANFATRGRQDWLALRYFLKIRIPWHVRNSEVRHVLMDQKEGQSWKGALLERLRNGGDDRGDIVTEKGSRRNNRRRHK
ncbi:HNH endonuclease [Colletotrichum scovillei]|uniref:HNH endonuclease n=1 Tax=Colletotrichum scovillei TaxID=1209932 RepID=A0A9P7UGA1_9PEZI|nr:HNH endonuclease [Colletotrichum scovillei]KAG7074158.1 HNH endonuclease [Colletotrichum scovillei]KAG7081370.1 HNH endonuclease [Colletotrichum scovillei]